MLLRNDHEYSYMYFLFFFFFPLSSPHSSLPFPLSPLPSNYLILSLPPLSFPLFFPPTSFLSHFTDRHDINAPRNQYALLGSPASLNCSYPGAFTAWKRNNTTISGNISSANISVEGQYTCDLYVPANEASIQMIIFLHVIGKCARH